MCFFCFVLFFQAEKKLQNQRRQWLRSESFHKSLQEMIQEHCIRKHHAIVPPDQNMVHFPYLDEQLTGTVLGHTCTLQPQVTAE